MPRWHTCWTVSLENYSPWFSLSAFVLLPGCSFALTFPSLWFLPSPLSLGLILPLCLSVPFIESPASLLSFRGNFSMSLYNSHWASSDKECTSRLSGAGDRLRDPVVTEGRGSSVRFVTSVSGEAGKTDTSVFRSFSRDSQVQPLAIRGVRYHYSQKAAEVLRG